MNKKFSEHIGENGQRQSARRIYLEFEKPIEAIENQIREFQDLSNSQKVDFAPEIRRLQQELDHTISRIYNDLSAWETVQVARHPQRPRMGDYLELLVRDFVELHGDKQYGEDRAIITGLGRIGRDKVMVIGHNRGRTNEEKRTSHCGCAHPEGYRKALKNMKLAEKFTLPVVCLIDTPGAYPGIGAEERGQAIAIAENIMEMTRLQIPIVCAIIGEGGSGGALGIGIGDRMAIMDFAYFSVISPEGCAAILFQNADRAASAASALRLTSKHLQRLGIVNEIIPEPHGGAHRNMHEAAHYLEQYLHRALHEVQQYDIDALIEQRYQRVRQIGHFQKIAEVILT
ncbi:MAG: acetyl-CoA carboxylase carboxyltransferase subunit alpha [Sedimentisphaerales bacterium]|nr:acetyl-CoA carboxylase carboxyltransferase subunit alpha [Sedimentisphaerales bacterium]